MANIQKFFLSDECDIFYNEDLHIVQSVWKGVYAEGETLRKIFNELIHALESKKASIIIADAREMLIINQNDQQWTINDWYPRAIAAGFRYQGLILSKDTFNELTVKRISKEYDEALITTQYFNSPSDALDWVREIREVGNESPARFN